MKSISYWATTGLIALAFAASGATNLTRSTSVIASFTRLGYPPYLATILGIWQVLGAATVLVPGFPRLKEWAYAGMFFDLTGAVVSHLVMADRASKLLVPLGLLAVAVGSWAQRPDSRMLLTLHEVRGSLSVVAGKSR